MLTPRTSGNLFDIVGRISARRIISLPAEMHRRFDYFLIFGNFA